VNDGAEGELWLANASLSTVRGERQLAVVSLQLLVRREEKDSWPVIRVRWRYNRDGIPPSRRKECGSDWL